MRSIAMLALVLAGCGGAKEVHLTILAGDTLDEGHVASIRTLQIAVLGDEPGSASYPLASELADRETTWIYKSEIEGRLQFEVIGRDVANGIVASGKSQIVTTKKSTFVAAEVYLGNNAPPDPDKSKLGEACTPGVDTCKSGFCVDGVCCDTACDGACSTCDGAQPGTCAPAGAGTNPRKGCAPDMVNTCGLDGTCDGGGACRIAPLGKVCGSPSCANDTFTSTALCDGKGTCMQPTTRSCVPYGCNTTASACATICTPTSGCASGVVCATGSTCGHVGIGARCFGPLDCSEGACIDGYCCSSTCDGACRSCKEPGHEGTCTMVVPGNADPHAVCSDAGATSCAENGKCDGAGGCQAYAAGTQCGDASCSSDGSSLIPARTCDGKGACPAAVPTSCGAYRCTSDGGPGCETSCGECTYYASMSPPFAQSCATGSTCTNHCLDAATQWSCE